MALSRVISVNAHDEKSDLPCAVRLPACAAERPPLDDYLRANGLHHATRFAAKDDDELNDAVLAGKFQRVIFIDLGDLLQAIWAGHIQYDRWIAARVRIDIVRPPFPGPVEWPAYVERMSTSYRDFKARQRRRQIFAAVCMSLLALAAIAGLFAGLPPFQK